MQSKESITPEWATLPAKKSHYFYVYKKDELVQVINLAGKKCYILGSDASCDYILENPSISSVHALVAHHRNGKCYLIDMKTGHGTFLDGRKIESKPNSLQEGTTVRFGNSTRLYVYSMKDSVSQTPKASAGESSQSETIKEKTVRASHILVKHKDSRNPSSWKEAVITRNKAEALSIIKGIEVDLRANFSPERFAQLAKLESHCSSAKRGGDLGKFGPRKMQKPFEDASFSLAVGQMSGPVETDSGVHLILRTE